MSHDNEYITLLKHAIPLHIEISIFPIVWAVLSILLDTQDNQLEYVKPEHIWRNWRQKQQQYRIACMIVLHMIFIIEFQIMMTMAQPLYRDNKMNS